MRFTSEEFYELVDSISLDKNGCRIWTGATRGGYPGPRVDGRQQYGNRLVLERTLGRPIRPGYMALHTCDVPMCVEPTHIYEGTSKDNAWDKVSRGRACIGERHRSYLYPEKNPRGETHGAAKLTQTQVEEIKNLCEKGTTRKELAQRYGLSYSHLCAVVRGDKWSHLK